ncbi:MAG: MFS transporter, partial [Myxococcales bacterium]
LGLVGFCLQLPVFLFSPLGGTLADRVNRRGLLMLTQSLAGTLALTLGALTLTGLVTVHAIFVLAVLLGIVNAFDQPTRQAFVAEMVGKQDLANAIAINSSLINSARVVGPAIAGLMIATVGEGWGFLLNGMSYGAVVAALAAIRLAPKPSALPRGSALAEMRVGFEFIAGHAPIRALLLLVGLVSLVGMPYVVLMPIFAGQILGGGPKALGILMGSTGVGALAGALLLAARTDSRGLGRWVGLAAVGFGAGIALFSASRVFALSCVVLAGVGFCMVVQLASSNTLLQTLTPDRLRGRVMAVYSMMFFGMAPFGSLLAGTAAGCIGAPLTVAIGGGLSMLGGTVFLLLLPSLRARAREIEAAAQVSSDAPLIPLSPKLQQPAPHRTQ